MQVICGKGWVRLGVTIVVTVAPAPHLLRTGPGHPVRGGRWAGPSNSENGSESLAGALFIFIFILSRSQSQVGLRPRRPTRDGHKGAHPHTLPNVNVGGARPPHGRCKSDFTSRSFYFKSNSHFCFQFENIKNGGTRAELPKMGIELLLTDEFLCSFANFSSQNALCIVV